MAHAWDTVTANELDTLVGSDGATQKVYTTHQYPTKKACNELRHCRQKQCRCARLVQSGRSLVQGSAPRRGRCSEPSAQATGTEDRNLATGNALSAPLPSAFCAAAAAFERHLHRSPLRPRHLLQRLPPPPLRISTISSHGGARVANQSVRALGGRDLLRLSAGCILSGSPTQMKEFCTQHSTPTPAVPSRLSIEPATTSTARTTARPDVIRF